MKRHWHSVHTVTTAFVHESDWGGGKVSAQERIGTHSSVGIQGRQEFGPCRRTSALHDTNNKPSLLSTSEESPYREVVFAINHRFLPSIAVEFPKIP